MRPGENALSFRGSLSNPLPPGRAVLLPGKDYVGIDTSQLPAGSVVPDGVPGSAISPPGHVSVYIDDPMLLKQAIIEFGKGPEVTSSGEVVVVRALAEVSERFMDFAGKLRSLPNVRMVTHPCWMRTEERIAEDQYRVGQGRASGLSGTPRRNLLTAPPSALARS